MTYWEIIADNLSKAGWSWGRGSAVDSTGRTIFIADAHRNDGKRFVVRADEKLTAFLEQESAMRGRLDHVNLRLFRRDRRISASILSSIYLLRAVRLPITTRPDFETTFPKVVSFSLNESLFRTIEA